MGTPANVRSISALEELNTALRRFQGDSINALNAAESEIKRTIEWLKERFQHWQHESQQKQRELADEQRRLQEMGRSKSPILPVAYPAQAAKVKQLQKAVAEARHQLQVVTMHTKRIEEAVLHFRSAETRLTVTVNNDLLRGAAFLVSRANILHNYASSGGGSINIGSTNSGSGAFPVGAMGGSNGIAGNGLLSGNNESKSHAQNSLGGGAGGILPGNGVSIGAGQAGTFVDKKRLHEHFAKHKGESQLPFHSHHEYENAANHFINSPLTNIASENVNAHGNTMRYDPTTGEYGEITPRGHILTYYILRGLTSGKSALPSLYHKALDRNDTNKGGLTQKEDITLRLLLAKYGIIQYEIIQIVREGKNLPGGVYPYELESLSGMVVTLTTAYSFWLDWVNNDYSLGEHDGTWRELSPQEAEDYGATEARRRLA